MKYRFQKKSVCFFKITLFHIIVCLFNKDPGICHAASLEIHQIDIDIYPHKWGVLVYVGHLGSQVFAGIYSFSKDRLEVLMDQRPVPVEELAEELNKLAAGTGRGLVLLGDGAEVYRTFLEENLTVDYDFAPPNLNAQRASSVAVRAFQLIREGRLQTAEEHCPDYLRVSQAERVRAEKGTAAGTADSAAPGR